MKAVVDLMSIGQLLNDLTERVAVPLTVVEEMIPAFTEISTLPMTPLLSEEPVVPAESAVSREETPAAEHPRPEERPKVVDQSQIAEPQV